MPRAHLIFPALAALLTVTGCAPGALDAGPEEGPSTPAPTTSETTPPPAASAAPAGQRFDDLDLAAALLPRPQTEDAAELGGEWQAETRAQIVPGLDPAAFAETPACAAAVAAAAEFTPTEVVAGGYSYGGTPTASVVAARMTSPEAASGWVTAITEASIACDAAAGQALEPGGLTHIRTLIEGAPAIRAAGMSGAGFGYDGEFHITTYVMATHDELIFVMLDEPAAAGWDTPIVAHTQAQLAAFDIAVG